jgi:small subunit ribosomal protein S16
MLKIRLQRVGRKHEPSFRLVLTDSKNATRSGKFKEILGSYDPRKSTEEIKVERVKHWLSKGAHPTGTVHNLLVTHKVINAPKKNVLPKKNIEKNLSDVEVKEVPNLISTEVPAEPSIETIKTIETLEPVTSPNQEPVEVSQEDAKIEPSAEQTS